MDLMCKYINGISLARPYTQLKLFSAFVPSALSVSNENILIWIFMREAILMERNYFKCNTSYFVEYTSDAIFSSALILGVFLPTDAFIPD